LDYLSIACKARVTPLFELGLPNTPFKKGAKPKPLPQHIDDSLELVRTEWTGLPLFLDLRHFSPENTPPDPLEIDRVFSVARQKQLLVVPVTSPLWPQVCQSAIRGVIQADGHGVMLRLEPVFFESQDKVLTLLQRLLRVLGIDKGQVDILIDLSYQKEKANVETLEQKYLGLLPDLGQWRTVTVAAGCFPDSISNNQIKEWIPYKRADWLGYNSVANLQFQANSRIPSYGDYGVRPFGRQRGGGRAPAPNIRYTSTNSIWTRRDLNQVGAIRAICQDLIKQSFFSGANYSEGDKLIAQKAANPGTNGTAEKWIEWCTNHHLELTSSQILSLP